MYGKQTNRLWHGVDHDAFEYLHFFYFIFSRPYLSNGRAIGMVVVCSSVRLFVRLSRMYCD